MSKLIEAAMKRTVLIFVTLSIILAWGAISAFHMQRDYLPPINNPTLMITVHAEGYQADQIKAVVSKPIEDVVRKIDGLQTVETNSFDEGLLLSLYFPLNYKMYMAEKAVSDAMGSISLPEGVDKPVITRVSTSSFPIMRLSLTSLSGKVEETALRTTVQAQISEQLKSLPGISDVRVTGAARNGYVITIRLEDLKKSGLTIDDVKSSLSDSRLTWLQGKITNSQVVIPIKASGWNDSVQDLQQLPIYGADGHFVALSTIADLTPSMVDLQTISRTDREASIVFDVLKTPSSNITDISKSVHNRIQDIPILQSGDLKLSVLFDQGEQVRSSLYGLLREGLLGCGLSMVCVFLFFRNIRSTMLIAISLPICFLATTGLLKTMGFGLNLLTVSGLIVAMGRVIDDSIVILDNMHRKIQEEVGKLSTVLLAQAAREMMPAIMASTATTVAVFIPIALVGGMISSAFSGFAWSVTIALLISLLVAVLIVPALYLAWHKGRKTATAISTEPVSMSVLNWAFLRKGRIIAVFILLFLAAGIGAFFLPINFLPAQKSGQINIQLEFPQGTSLTQVDAAVLRMEQTLKSDTAIATFSSVLGSTFTPQFDDVFDVGGGWIQGTNIANIAVAVNGKADIDKVTSSLRNRLASQSGGAICTVTNQNISGDDSQLKIDLTGADAVTLDAVSKTIRTRLLQVQGLSVAGAADDNEAPHRYQLTLNREMLKQSGVLPEQVFERIREYLSEGTKLDIKMENQEAVPFEMRTDLLKRVGQSSSMIDPETEILTFLGKETFKGKGGEDVRLDKLASLKPVAGQIAVRERDGRPFSIVTANITSRNVEKVTRQVKSILNQMAFPSGVRYSMGGISAQVNQMITEMGIALSVSMVLVLFILSIVFRGWRAPLTVLACIPPAFIGSVFGLLVSGGEWNLATLVGLLMLSGIVATNGIVLVDKIERNLANGMDAKEAILHGTVSRVRPVLMTAIATVLTLLPLCISGSEDSVISQSLGIVVVCGMISSTMSCLLAIPMLYEWMFKRRTVTSGAAKLNTETVVSG